MGALIQMRSLPVRATLQPVETYRGEQYRLERREIATFSNAKGYRVVWCWEVLSGPAEGHFGGKQATKDDARRWAKHEIDAWAEEVAR